MIRAKMYNEGQIKLPIYNTSSLTKDQLLIWGVDGSSTSTCVLIDSTAKSQDAFAVLCETPSATAGNISSTIPVVYQAQVQLVENHKIWKIYYDMAAANDYSITSYASSDITTGTIDDNLDGSWVYVNSGTGQGELRFVRDADTASLIVSTAFTSTLDSSTDIILIRNVGRPTDGVALDTTRTMIASDVLALDHAGILVLKNFVEASIGVLELDPSLNSELTGMDDLHKRNVRFFSHIIFADNDSSGRGI